MKLNKRGFSLVEILSATVLISILSVFSVTQYNRQRTKSLTKEAQIQLGHLHRMERTYFMEHNTFTYELEGNMFPKGQLLYNVGFGTGNPDWKANPCGHSGSSFKNNYYELCGDTQSDGRKECWFTNKHGKTIPPALIQQYRELRSAIYHKPNENCNPSTTNRPLPTSDRAKDCDVYKLKREFTANDDKFYKKFIAYAVGDIKDPKNFISAINPLDADQLDVWRINGNGFLEHCNDPLDDNTPNTCLNPPMKNTENDPSDYCS